MVIDVIAVGPRQNISRPVPPLTPSPLYFLFRFLSLSRCVESNAGLFFFFKKKGERKKETNHLLFSSDETKTGRRTTTNKNIRCRVREREQEQERERKEDGDSKRRTASRNTPPGVGSKEREKDREEIRSFPGETSAFLGEQKSNARAHESERGGERYGRMRVAGENKKYKTAARIRRRATFTSSFSFCVEEARQKSKREYDFMYQSKLKVLKFLISL